MRHSVRILFVAFAAAVLADRAAGAEVGFASDANFIVLTRDPTLARPLIVEANRYRREAAVEWLGSELPSGVGRTGITVESSASEDWGLTWAKDSADRKLHKIWLTTAKDLALGSTLHHEVIHTVLATAFPAGLPVWADEGAASLADDPQRAAIRQRLLEGYVRSGNAPSLEQVLNARHLGSNDQAGYAVATSLTTFLMTRGGSVKVLQFATDGKTAGWNVALQQYYGLRNVAALQQAWQQWLIAGR